MDAHYFVSSSATRRSIVEKIENERYIRFDKVSVFTKRNAI